MKITDIPGLETLVRRLDSAIRWRVQEEIGPLREEIDRLRSQAEWTANEMARLVPHVAAQEVRLEDLRTMLADDALTPTGELGKERSLLDEIRREHALVRERLGMLAEFGDRLRALEELPTRA